MEPTLEDILAKLQAAIDALNEALRRILAKDALAKLKQRADTKDLETTVWSPAVSHDNTDDSDLDNLTDTQHSDWLAQSKAQVELLIDPL